ncbi:hypothetical protein HPG69_011177 [Diceros bicornis minor]|uniref:Uncharacterized protein n=1 Tax=Diceros bicornis minor TaxID=77932 RepID=A0A7J7FJI5_DICBM|nr:hypothetical protein HPG69_011177 [Diceros bicornis minor]
MDKGRPMMDELAGPVCWRGTTPRGAGRPLSNQSPRKPSAKTRSQASVWGLGGPDGQASGGSAGAEGDPHRVAGLAGARPGARSVSLLGHGDGSGHTSCGPVMLTGPVVLTAVVQQLTPSCSVAGADRFAGVGSTWCLVYNPLAHYGHRRAREQIVFVLSTPRSSSWSVESPEPPRHPEPSDSCPGPAARDPGTFLPERPVYTAANTSLLQGFWCQPARQLSRDQLSALIRRMASQQVFLRAWQLSCLANLAARHGLQGDFSLHPADLLLFYK